MATINIDSELIKSIVDTYRNAPSDPETSTNFADRIFAKIDKFRIKAVNPIDDTTVNNTSNMNESHCHTFYRMLGLPIVSSFNTFYSPGYYGKQMTTDKDKIKKINDNQHSNLLGEEELRERIAFQNGERFLGRNATSIQYKIDMLQYPRKLNIMKEDIGPFATDKQQETITKRSSNNQISSHILRPFKCNASIAAPNKMLIAQKNFAAPFHKNTTTVDTNIYKKTYLETICKIRFETKVSIENDEFIDNLKAELAVVQINGQNLFESVLNNQNVIEIYITNIMFGVFVQTVLQYSLKINEYSSLATKLSLNTEIATKLSNKIKTLKENINYYDAARAFIPTDVVENKGHMVSSNNLHPGIILPDLMLLLDSPAKQLRKELEDTITQQQRHRKEFEEITKERFYFSGEVLGLGSIDIMAMMLAFWIIPQDHLVGMLDEASFNRLYEGRGNRSLKNEVVEARKSGTTISIDEVIGKFDETVYNLLALADSIIEYSNREATSGG
jgi:hypothetical protein